MCKNVEVRIHRIQCSIRVFYAQMYDMYIDKDY